MNVLSGIEEHSDPMNGTNLPPKASIIIAAKNADAFIAKALRSALAQTMTDLEIIVIDDGSTDGTSEVVKACANGDPRVQLLRNAHSQGVSSARNRAIAQARGDWIAVLDADDEFMPNRLERMVGEATARDLDVLADNLALRDFATNGPVRRAYPEDWMTQSRLITLADLLERDAPDLKHKNFGYIKPIMRRSFLTAHGLAYREDVWCAEDFLLYAQSVIAGARFGVIDDMLYIYSERSGSASSSGTAVHVEVARVNQLVGQLAHTSSPAEYRAIQMRQTRLDYFAFVQLFKNREFREAGRILVRVPIGYVAKSATAAVIRRLHRLRAS